MRESDLPLTAPELIESPLRVLVADADITPLLIETPLIVSEIAAVMTPLEDIVAEEPRK